MATLFMVFKLTLQINVHWNVSKLGTAIGTPTAAAPSSALFTHLVLLLKTLTAQTVSMAEAVVLKKVRTKLLFTFVATLYVHLSSSRTSV